jgi:hypothetical protein
VRLRFARGLAMACCALCAVLPRARHDTRRGVRGGVLWLPLQLSVLHVSSPAVTPTNMLFNLAAVPGRLLRFWHERRLLNQLLAARHWDAARA